MLAFPNRIEQWVVLHIARSDLQHIAVAGKQGDILRRHDLRYHWHPGDLACFSQQLQPGFSQTLEGIWGGTRFKCTPAQGMSTRLAHCDGSLQQLGAVFHRAGAGDQHDALVANFHPVQRKQRVLGDKFARSQLIWS